MTSHGLPSICGQLNAPRETIGKDLFQYDVHSDICIYVDEQFSKYGQLADLQPFTPHPFYYTFSRVWLCHFALGLPQLRAGPLEVGQLVPEWAGKARG